MGDNLCVSYHEQFGVNAKIIRIFHTYGPGLLMDDGRVFGDFCKSIVTGENIVLHSTGEAMRPFCYITDAIIAMFKVLLDGECTAYNMANMDAEISIKELAELLVGMYPEKHLSVVIDSQNQGEAAKMKSPLDRLVPDCDKLRGLGWSPKVSVKDGFRKTIDYMSATYKM
jgi:nucleoside-diphosphate-sugar epimerase